MGMEPISPTKYLDIDISGRFVCCLQSIRKVQRRFATVASVTVSDPDSKTSENYMRLCMIMYLSIQHVKWSDHLESVLYYPYYALEICDLLVLFSSEGLQDILSAQASMSAPDLSSCQLFLWRPALPPGPGRGPLLPRRAQGEVAWLGHPHRRDAWQGCTAIWQLQGGELTQ